MTVDDETLRRIVGEIVRLAHPDRVILMSRERFEETRNVVGGIAYPAHKYGKVLYEAA